METVVEVDSVLLANESWDHTTETTVECMAISERIRDNWGADHPLYRMAYMAADRQDSLLVRMTLAAYCTIPEGALDNPGQRTGRYSIHRDGHCPKCKGNDGYFNINRDQYSYCSKCKTRWHFGSNLYSSWRHETEEDWARNVERFRDYEEVDPFYYGPEFYHSEVKLGATPVNDFPF